jgi:hypothetical protein
MTKENDIAGCCENTCKVWILELLDGLDLSRRRIDGLETAVEAVRRAGSAAREPRSWIDGAALIDKVLLLDGLDVIAAFDGWNVEKAKFRIIG